MVIYTPLALIHFYREGSGIIYFIHMYVWTIYYWIMYREKRFGIDSFVATSLISTLLSVVYIIVDKKRNSLRIKKSEEYNWRSKSGY